MRLSKAILLGLPEIRFTNDTWLVEHADGSCEGCLVGAALFALGKKAGSARLQLQTIWPWTSDVARWHLRKCVCGRSFRPYDHMASVLTHLANDYKDGRLSSAEIADFIRSIEPAEEETPLCSPEVARPERVKA